MEFILFLLSVVVGGLATLGLLIFAGYFAFAQDSHNPDYQWLKQQLDFLDEELEVATEKARVQQLTEMRTELAPMVHQKAPQPGPTPRERAIFAPLCVGLALAVGATTAKVAVLMLDWDKRSHPDLYNYPSTDHSHLQYILLWLIIAGCAVAVAVLIGWLGNKLWVNHHGRPVEAA